MKTQSDLFHLITSLTKSEKRSFKIYASRHVIGERNNYTILFDAIDRQKEYDEEALRRELASESFISHLSVTKNYLYRMILESLRVHHAEQTIYSEITGYLQHIELLHNRGLYEQCRKIIRKAKKVATEHRKYILILEIMRWERETIQQELYAGSSDQEIEAFFHDYHNTVRMVDNLAHYSEMSARMYIHYLRAGRPRSSEELLQLEAIMDNPLLQDESQALSIEAKEYFYHLHSTYHFLLGDYENAYRYSARNIQLSESIPGQIEQQPVRYLGMLTNYLMDAFFLNRFEEFFAGIEKIHAFSRLLTVRQESLDFEIFKSLANLELCAYVATGNYEQGLVAVTEVSAGIKKYEKELDKSTRLTLAYNIACIYFGACRYNEALRWINTILNDSEVEMREEIYCFAHIFNLVVHFELGNTDFMEYIIKSTYRYLYKRNRLYQLETVVLGFIRRLPGIHSHEQLVAVCKVVKAELEPLATHPLERKAFEFFDFLSWLESKIECVPFAAVIQRKAHTIISQPSDVCTAL